MWVWRASCSRICGSPDLATWRRKVSDTVEGSIGEPSAFAKMGESSGKTAGNSGSRAPGVR